MSRYADEQRVRQRDGTPVYQARCPQCSQWADIDEDQRAERTSLVCERCGWHGMIAEHRERFFRGSREAIGD